MYFLDIVILPEIQHLQVGLLLQIDIFYSLLD
jgi:hypothetical protein